MHTPARALFERDTGGDWYMGSLFTGNHDIAIELSEELLAARLSEKLVGITEGTDAIFRITQVRIRGLDMNPEPMVELSLHISHGNARGVNPLSGKMIVLRGLRLVMSFPVKLKLLVQDKKALIDFALDSLAGEQVAFSWDTDSYNSVEKQLQNQGIYAGVDFVAIILKALLVEDLKKKKNNFPPQIIEGLEIDPNADAFPGASPIRGHTVELYTRAATNQSCSVISLLVSTLAGHSQGSASNKTRTMLKKAQGLAMGISPDAIRDGVVCPALATFFGTEASQLCPVCGGGAVDLKALWDVPVIHRLIVDRIDVTFKPGQIELGCNIVGSGPAIEINGSIKLLVSFYLKLMPTGSFLMAVGQLGSVSLDLDTHDLADVLLLNGTQAIADKFAELLCGAVSIMAAQRLSKPIAQIQLPQGFEGLKVHYESVEVDEDGIAVHARVPVQPRTLPAPTLHLETTVTNHLVALGSGNAGGTCMGQGYHYVDYDARQMITTTLVTDIEPFLQWSWTLADQPVSPSGGIFHLATHNTGLGTDAQDHQVTATVGLSSNRRVVTVGNRPEDGNYLLVLHCAIDDGIYEQPRFITLSVDGQPRVFDPQYALDALHCAARTTTVQRHLRWAASDLPEGVNPVEEWFNRVIGRPGPFGGPVPGPWASASALGQWLVPLAGGVMRSAAGHILMQNEMPDDERHAIVDEQAFRTIPRQVVRPMLLDSDGGTDWSGEVGSTVVSHRMSFVRVFQIKPVGG